MRPPHWLRQLHEQLSENPCGKFALADLATRLASTLCTFRASLDATTANPSGTICAGAGSR